MWFQLTQGLTMFKCRQTLRHFVDSHPTNWDGVCHTTLNANARYAKLDFFNLFFKKREAWYIKMILLREKKYFFKNAQKKLIICVNMF